MLCLLTASVFLVACGAGSDKNVAPTATGQPPTPPGDATAIEKVDFSQNPDVQTMLRQTSSGQLDAQAIVYADVTGDGREDAIVPVASGGTLGNVAYLVFTLHGSTPALILTRTLDRSSAGGLKMTVQDGKLVETAGVYGDEDPLCCPSQLRMTTFRWDGTQLQVAGETTAPNPAGAKQ